MPLTSAGRFVESRTDGTDDLHEFLAALDLQKYIYGSTI